jgi:SAM-dependent methyltransferase
MSWRRDELMTIPCDLCGSGQSRPLFRRADGLNVVECARCGLAFINPRPKDEHIPALYAEDYCLRRKANGYVDRYGARKRLRTLRHLGVEPHGRVLEVGCATGEFCDSVRRRCTAATQVLGLDICETAVEEARRRWRGLTFRHGTIDDLDEKDAFDVILAFELIEHVASPGAFFRKASALLAPGGALCLTTPNLDCGSAVGFDRWHGFAASFEHLFFFSAATLAGYAAKHGMRLSSALSGNGRGIAGAADPGTGGGGAVRRIKDSVRQTRLCRMLSRTLRAKELGYQSRESRHTLLVVLAKQSGDEVLRPFAAA